MKKARKIRIMGTDYKYFFDSHAVNEDGEVLGRIILYGPDNSRWDYNGVGGTMTGASIKRAFMDRKFIKVR